MSKNSKDTKVVKRRLGADNSRLKEVLLDAAPDTDIKDEDAQNEDLKVIPGETNSPEQAVNSPDDKPAESLETPKQKKAPANKRAYTYAECAKIIEMINAGKTLDEIHQEAKRPVLSLMYKFFNPKRGVKMCRDVEELKKFFPVAE